MKEPIDTLRAFLLAILFLGLTGSGADLLLLAHYEDVYQLIPLVLIAAAFVTLSWNAVAGSQASRRAVQSTMCLFVAAGFAGVWFHGSGNMEFQREIDPSVSGSALLLKILRAKAPPALAPGVMIQLGLLGLAFSYRPHLPVSRSSPPHTGEKS